MFDIYSASLTQRLTNKRLLSTFYPNKKTYRDPFSVFFIANFNNNIF